MSRAPIQFLGAYLKRPGRVGAVAPSSTYLSRMMIRDFDLAHARSVVELGPGTGAVTQHILDAIGPKTRYIGVEREQSFVDHLRARYPRADFVHGCAEETPQYLAERGVEGTDYVISGLPWAAFGRETQERLLSAVIESLVPGGQFATFAYIVAASLPKGRRFRRLLSERFSRLDLTPVVWRNLPPAFVYVGTH